MGQTQSELLVPSTAAAISQSDDFDKFSISKKYFRSPRNGTVSVQINSLPAARGLLDRSSSHLIDDRGALFYGSTGNPDELLEAFSGIGTVAGSSTNCGPPPPRKFVMHDNRAHELLVSRLGDEGWHVFPSPETFSRHSGTCLIIGDRSVHCPPLPIRLGDCFRLGSVGVVVSEIRSSDDGEPERLDAKSLQYLRDEAMATDLFAHEQYDIDEACLAANEGGFDRITDKQALSSPAAEEKKKKKSSNELEQDSASDMSYDEFDDEDDANRTVYDDGGNDSMVGSADAAQKGAATDTTPLSRFFCYMCYESTDTPQDPLVAPCLCLGDTRYVHVQCLQKWYQSTGKGLHGHVVRTTISGAPACKICGGGYKTAFRNSEGVKVSLLETCMKGPYISLIVVTKHDTNNSLYNTKFRLHFGAPSPADTVGDPVVAPTSLTIGRSSICNMVLDYRTVSTKHARMLYENGNFFLQDLRSSNGTMLYLREPCHISYNYPIKIRMGRSTLTLQVNPSWGNTASCLCNNLNGNSLGFIEASPLGSTNSSVAALTSVIARRPIPENGVAPVFNSNVHGLSGMRTASPSVTPEVIYATILEVSAWRLRQGPLYHRLSPSLGRSVRQESPRTRAAAAAGRATELNHEGSTGGGTDVLGRNVVLAALHADTGPPADPAAAVESKVVLSDLQHTHISPYPAQVSDNLDHISADVVAADNTNELDEASGGDATSIVNASIAAAALDFSENIQRMTSVSGTIVISDEATEVREVGEKAVEAGNGSHEPVRVR